MLPINILFAFIKCVEERLFYKYICLYLRTAHIGIWQLARRGSVRCDYIFVFYRYIFNRFRFSFLNVILVVSSSFFFSSNIHSTFLLFTHLSVDYIKKSKRASEQNEIEFIENTIDGSECLCDAVGCHCARFADARATVCEYCEYVRIDCMHAINRISVDHWTKTKVNLLALVSTRHTPTRLGTHTHSFTSSTHLNTFKHYL